MNRTPPPTAGDHEFLTGLQLPQGFRYDSSGEFASLVAPDGAALLFVDHPDPAKRFRANGPRFVVTVPGDEGEAAVYTGDDWQAAIDVARAVSLAAMTDDSRVLLTESLQPLIRRIATWGELKAISGDRLSPQELAEISETIRHPAGVYTFDGGPQTIVYICRALGVE